MITEEKLLKIVGFSTTTLQIYLCRAEFSHIQRINVAPKKFIYSGVTDTDLIKLKAFRRRRRASMDGIDYIIQRRAK